MHWLKKAFAVVCMGTGNWYESNKKWGKKTINTRTTKRQRAGGEGERGEEREREEREEEKREKRERVDREQKR